MSWTDNHYFGRVSRNRYAELSSEYQLANILVPGLWNQKGPVQMIPCMQRGHRPHSEMFLDGNMQAIVTEGHQAGNRVFKEGIR